MNVKRAQWALVIVLLGLAVAVTLYFAFENWSRRIGSYDRAYTAINVGDSRDAVVATMGEPQAVRDCSFTPFSDKKLEAEYHSKCSQEYEYVELMARYIISFDGKGTVIHKSKAISP